MIKIKSMRDIDKIENIRNIVENIKMIKNPNDYNLAIRQCEIHPNILAICLCDDLYDFDDEYNI